MSQRFIKLMVSEEVTLLLTKHPNAFLLLTCIASKARRFNGHPDGLIIGDALIESSDESIPLSRQNFRTALKKLEEFGYIKIISNGKKLQGCRKSTIKVTIKGMLVNLCNSKIYDINPERDNQQTNQRLTNDQPTFHSESDPLLGSSPPSSFSLPPSPLEPPPPISISLSPSSPNSQERKEFFSPPLCKKQSKGQPDSIIFSFENSKFEGITPQDREIWKTAYPSINLDQELAKATSWIKGAGSKGKKRKWRAFLNNWFMKAENYSFGKQAAVEQKKEVVDQSQWEQINRKKFFQWRAHNYNAFKHLEYKNDYVINTRKGTELSVKMNPDAFENTFGAFAGLKHG